MADLWLVAPGSKTHRPGKNDVAMTVAPGDLQADTEGPAPGALDVETAFILNLARQVHRTELRRYGGRLSVEKRNELKAKRVQLAGGAVPGDGESNKP